MPALENQRHELFCQGLVKGKTSDRAYADAGYEPNRKNAARLKANEVIIARYQELMAETGKQFIITRQVCTESILENMQKALGRIPVRIGKVGEEREVYVYRGDVANRAIQLAGAEIGMFVEKKELKITNLYEKMTDDELILELSNEARKLLAYTPPEKPENSGD